MSVAFPQEILSAIFALVPLIDLVIFGPGAFFAVPSNLRRQKAVWEARFSDLEFLCRRDAFGRRVAEFIIVANMADPCGQLRKGFKKREWYGALDLAVKYRFPAGLIMTMQRHGIFGKNPIRQALDEKAYDLVFPLLDNQTDPHRHAWTLHYNMFTELRRHLIRADRVDLVKRLWAMELSYGNNHLFDLLDWIREAEEFDAVNSYEFLCHFHPSN